MDNFELDDRDAEQTAGTPAVGDFTALLDGPCQGGGVKPLDSLLWTDFRTVSHREEQCGKMWRCMVGKYENRTAHAPFRCGTCDICRRQQVMSWFERLDIEFPSRLQVAHSRTWDAAFRQRFSRAKQSHQDANWLRVHVRTLAPEELNAVRRLPIDERTQYRVRQKPALGIDGYWIFSDRLDLDGSENASREDAIRLLQELLAVPMLRPNTQRWQPLKASKLWTPLSIQSTGLWTNLGVRSPKAWKLAVEMVKAYRSEPRHEFQRRLIETYNTERDRILLARGQMRRMQSQ